MDSEVLAEKLYTAWANETPAVHAPSGAFWTPKAKAWLELSVDERNRWRGVADVAIDHHVKVEDWHGRIPR